MAAIPGVLRHHCKPACVIAVGCSALVLLVGFLAFNLAQLLRSQNADVSVQHLEVTTESATAEVGERRGPTSFADSADLLWNEGPSAVVPFYDYNEEYEMEEAASYDGASLIDFLLHSLDAEKVCNDRALVARVSASPLGQSPAWKEFVELRCSGMVPPPTGPRVRVDPAMTPPGSGSSPVALSNTNGAQWLEFQREQNRTACKPRNTLVKVDDEKIMWSSPSAADYHGARVEQPSRTTNGKPKQAQACAARSSYEYSVYPPCVQVKRCGGCCNAPLTCVPDHDPMEYTVNKVVWEFHDCGKQTYNSKIRNATFSEHKNCTCACVNRMDKCSGKQVFNETLCRCECPAESKPVDSKCPRAQHWDGVKQCACVCTKVKPCTTGRFWSEKTCSCTKSSRQFSATIR